MPIIGFNTFTSSDMLILVKKLEKINEESRSFNDEDGILLKKVYTSGISIAIMPTYEYFKNNFTIIDYEEEIIKDIQAKYPDNYFEIFVEESDRKIRRKIVLNYSDSTIFMRVREGDYFKIPEEQRGVAFQKTLNYDLIAGEYQLLEGKICKTTNRKY